MVYHRFETFLRTKMTFCNWCSEVNCKLYFLLFQHAAGISETLLYISMYALYYSTSLVQVRAHTLAHAKFSCFFFHEAKVDIVHPRSSTRPKTNLLRMGVLSSVYHWVPLCSERQQTSRSRIAPSLLPMRGDLAPILDSCRGSTSSCLRLLQF